VHHHVTPNEVTAKIIVEGHCQPRPRHLEDRAVPSVMPRPAARDPELLPGPPQTAGIPGPHLPPVKRLTGYTDFFILDFWPQTDVLVA
jgi:hypothetical protein